jgi:predicted DsbA family dithiol-disulfide isomerase
MPNTRLALEAAEWVRVHHLGAFDEVHAALFRAQFAEGRAIDDREVVAAIVADAGAPADDVLAAHEDGRASVLVDASMAEAHGLDITSTPTWVLDDGFVVPGAFDHATLERWITKILARSARGASAPT